MKGTRLVSAATLLVLLVVLGAWPIGRAPALGSFLDPAHGVWALARNAVEERSRRAARTRPAFQSLAKARTGLTQS